MRNLEEVVEAERLKKVCLSRVCERLTRILEELERTFCDKVALVPSE